MENLPRIKGRPSRDLSNSIPAVAVRPTATGASTSPLKIASLEQDGSLEDAEPLEPESFPHQPRRGSSALPTTIANVRYMLRSYGIKVGYNVIKKKMFTSLPRQSGAPDNIAQVALTQVLSLANLNGMSTGLVPGFVEAIADDNPWNPVADWIESKPWDGVDRLDDIYGTLQVRPDFPDELKRRIMYCWLLSCVAAAMMPTGFSCRGVLTLQGRQGLGKTRWIMSLVPDVKLRDDVVRLGHHMDARNKDDIVTAVSHWIVEIGELDSTFRKDVGALKGFVSNDRDTLRRPYGRVNSEYPRKTVFAATVNDPHFLVDTTGNTRFWTLPAVHIDHAHTIDMQQVFAQLLIDFQDGAKWRLSEDEQAALEARNQDHRAVSVIHDRIESRLDLSRKNDPNLPTLTATEMLGHIGYERPTNGQSRECGAALRRLLGEPRKLHGIQKWGIPFADGLSPITSRNDHRVRKTTDEDF